MGYTASNITGLNSPTAGADKTTFSAVFDAAAQAADQHNHTAGKGLPIPTGGIADNAVTRAKLAAVEQLPIGVLLPYVGAVAPSGWLLCNGATVSRTTYANLYAVIGNSHGEGDGSTTFHLPDTRGRFIRGKDAGQGRDPNAGARAASATGGNTGDNVGTIQDDATAANGLSGAAHSHTIPMSSALGLGNNVAQGENDTSGNATSNTSTVTINSTDSETRPINLSENFIIKF